MDRWVKFGIRPGEFLSAVLSNNLREAFGRADDINQARMFDIVQYCYNEIPSPCWGSPEAMRTWKGTETKQRP